MEKEFVPYEIALVLKELGFNEECFGYFHGIYEKDLIIYPIKGCVNSALLEQEISAPLYQQTFRWFLEKYKLFVETSLFEDGIGFISYIKQIKQGDFLEVYQLQLATPNRGTPNWNKQLEDLACLKKLTEIVKNENTN